MKNLVSYVTQYQDRTFAQMPFNELDGVILSQLAYVDYRLLQEVPHKFSKIDSVKLLEKSVARTWNPAGNYALLLALRQSRRYQQLSWSHWVSQTDMALEEQFSAVTLSFAPHRYFVAFRGTTATLVDWKEDFNMTFLDTIPSQRTALRYFERIAHELPGRYYLGGHSKGGNLASYVVAHSRGRLQEAIVDVYSADGPGLKAPLETTIKRKIHKLIPEASVIGLLLEPETNYQVVKSQATGIKQHDPYTWQVTNHTFDLVAAPSHLSQFTQQAVARWLTNLDDATKQEFLDSLYSLLATTKYQEIDDFTNSWRGTLKLLAPELMNTKHETRQQWHHVTGQLLNSVLTEAKDLLQEKKPRLKNNRRDSKH